MVGPEALSFKNPKEPAEAAPNAPKIGGMSITLAVIVRLQAAHQFFL
jgi:hypothetical protein